MPYDRANINALAAYAPGEQPERAQVVKLNTNENPYPPADAVLEAIRSVSAESLRRYPPPRAERFRKLAAGVHDVEPTQVIATNGGDELLRMAITAFCEPVGSVAASGSDSGGGLGVAEPSYSLYPVLARIHDTALTTVPLVDDFALPADFAKRMLEAGCRLVIIVNPHAPSGRLQPIDPLRQIAEALRGQAVLLIDEAYVDFAERDALELVRPGSGVDNVLVLRSLSKGYSLAGLRFGYGLGHPELIAALDKVRDSYNTDALAQAAACAALEHRDAARKNWQRVIAERTRLGELLASRGFNVLPSQSNFLLTTPPPPEAPPEGPPQDPQARRCEAAAGSPPPPPPEGVQPASEIYDALRQRNIFVRYFDHGRLRDKLRITVGTPEQNDALVEALDQLEVGGLKA